MNPLLLAGLGLLGVGALALSGSGAPAIIPPAPAYNPPPAPPPPQGWNPLSNANILAAVAVALAKETSYVNLQQFGGALGALGGYGPQSSALIARASQLLAAKASGTAPPPATGGAKPTIGANGVTMASPQIAVASWVTYFNSTSVPMAVGYILDPANKVTNADHVTWFSQALIAAFSFSPPGSTYPAYAQQLANYAAILEGSGTSSSGSESGAGSSAPPVFTTEPSGPGGGLTLPHNLAVASDGWTEAYPVEAVQVPSANQPANTVLAAGQTYWSMAGKPGGWNSVIGGFVYFGYYNPQDGACQTPGEPAGVCILRYSVTNGQPKIGVSMTPATQAGQPGPTAASGSGTGSFMGSSGPMTDAVDAANSWVTYYFQQGKCPQCTTIAATAAFVLNPANDIENWQHVQWFGQALLAIPGHTTEGVQLGILATQLMAEQGASTSGPMASVGTPGIWNWADEPPVPPYTTPVSAWVNYYLGTDYGSDEPVHPDDLDLAMRYAAEDGNPDDVAGFAQSLSDAA